MENQKANNFDTNMSEKLKIGLQVYSVRDDAARDFKSTMLKIKEMGYDGVELAGMYGILPEKIREILDEVGLCCISAHVSYDELIKDTENTVAAYKTVGCQFIGLPYMSAKDRPNAPDFSRVISGINKISSECKKHGIQLIYHNHDFEFEKMPNGEFQLDALYASFDEDVLMPEFDTCWVLVAGQNPVEYINKYAGRCPVVHLKDFVGSKSENMYELIGIDKKADATGEFKFRPVGYGVQDFPAIIKASENSGAKWLIVEQDSSYEIPPLKAAEMSREYLKSIYR